MPSDSDPQTQPEITFEEVTLDQTRVEAAYDAEQIQVLEGLEAVRKRPGMYVGDNGHKGLHQMFREVLDNSVDEALAGHCDLIIVTLHEDNSISVRDNGRGIPVAQHQKMGVSALEVVMTVLHAGGKFDGGSYKTSGGLHGVGVSCTNALSEWCTVEVKRDGGLYTQKYRQGKPQGPVEEIGKAEGTGTYTRWKADPVVMDVLTYDTHIIKNRMKELAYLMPYVTFEFINEQDPEDSEVFHFEGGIRQQVLDINEGHTVLHPVIYLKKARRDETDPDKITEVEVAMQFHDDQSYVIYPFSNNIYQPDGGTHVSGFQTALTRVVNSYGRKSGLVKEKQPNLTSDDVIDGLTAVISVRLPNPSYNSQDKVKLVTPEVQHIVNSLVGEALTEEFEQKPAVAKKVVEKAIRAQQAREAARKAYEAVRRSNSMDSFGLPGKLHDCISKNAEECELFLVEGDSAGGSAKGARDRMTQALLPLRGKILNVEKNAPDKAFSNNEIQAMIAALGAGVDYRLDGKSGDEEPVLDFSEPVEESEEEKVPETNGKSNGKKGQREGSLFDLSKLRYHKIIIMTDADVDGEHIRTLLLTFFYRYMKPLITEGYVYLAQPPLFVIKSGNNERHYAHDEKQRDEILKQIKKKNVLVTRFKGLGEMNPEELEETTMNPASRRLVQVKFDPEFSMEIEKMFSRLMGPKVEPRREFIEKHARETLDIDWHT
jgi:DNA gyrase subunit B